MLFRAISELRGQLWAKRYLCLVCAGVYFAILLRNTLSWRRFIVFMRAVYSVADTAFFNTQTMSVLFTVPVLIFVLHRLLKSDDGAAIVLRRGSKLAAWSVCFVKTLVISLCFAILSAGYSLFLDLLLGVDLPYSWDSSASSYYLAFEYTTDRFSAATVSLTAFVSTWLTLAIFGTAFQLLRWSLGSDIIAALIVIGDSMVEFYNISSPKILTGRLSLDFGYFAEGVSPILLTLCQTVFLACIFVAGVLASGRKEFLYAEHKK